MTVARCATVGWRLPAWRLVEELEKTQASLQRRDVVAWLICHDFFTAKMKVRII
jgi:hypothetical protein